MLAVRLCDVEVELPGSSLHRSVERAEQIRREMKSLDWECQLWECQDLMMTDGDYLVLQEDSKGTG